MWDYLERIYKQGNAPRLYQLKQKISSLSQESHTIQEFYFAMTIWNEMDMIDSDVPKEVLETDIKLGQQPRSRHFLIKLQPKFEHVWATIINRSSTHNINDILAKLLTKETRLKSLSSVPDTAFLVSTQKGKFCDFSKVECYNCHETGHLANHCNKKKVSESASLFCKYSKEQGHLMEDCKKHPTRRGIPRAYAVVGVSTASFANNVCSSPSITSSPPVVASPNISG